MMYEGKHIHYSPVDNKPLCSYSTKLCKQRRLNNYAFCIRHILEDKSAPFKQCAHVAKYNNQKCTNPIPNNEDREYCNSHMQVAGMAPKKERKAKKEKDVTRSPDGKVKFADRLKALLKTDNEISMMDEQVSVDDPYTFSESTSDTSSEKSPLGSVGSSPKAPDRIAEQLNKVVTTSTQQTSQQHTLQMSSLSAALSMSSENKNAKLNMAKSSKTMNRLQAKIAQNKILDKLKKNSQDAASPPPTMVTASYLTNDLVGAKNGDSLHSNGSSSEPSLPSIFVQSGGGGGDCSMVRVLDTLSAGHHRTSNKVPSSSSDTSSSTASSSFAVQCGNNNVSYGTGNVLLSCGIGSKNAISSSATGSLKSSRPGGSEIVSLQPRKVWKLNRCPKQRKEIPEPLQRVQTIWDQRRLCRADLYPLGIELSDSDSDDSESESLQRHWFCTWDKGDTLQVNSEFLPNSRPARLSVRHAEMRRQYRQLCSAHSASTTQRKQHQQLMSALIQSTKLYPNKTSEVVHKMHTKISENVKVRRQTGLVKRSCCYQNDKEMCDSVALPHTRHCVKHIMYNVDQLLFEHCTAKFADNTQCCVPVFDICHELPLCPEHARKRDNYNKMSAEPKPKKPRKKTKPSALTRPPKRGKKKKRQSGIRPNKQSTPSAVNAETASTGVPSTMNIDLDASHLSPGPTELNADDISKGLDDHLDSDLDGQLSPGSIEKSLELPLDTAELANQATRLLEEHDFTEVLNKIPDDAFNDLFTEGKNGDFLPTKEETEELERALAAVDKDVKSLEKLSADGNDMAELDNSMDLHESLLNADNLAGHHGMDESTLSELTQSNMAMDNLNAMTSGLSTNDLNSISQVLSTITTDSMVANPLPVSTGLVDGGTTTAAAILQSHHHHPHQQQQHHHHHHHHHIPGVHLLPDLVQGQLQLQVPVNATQATNFVLSPHLLGPTLGATFTTTTTSADVFNNSGGTSTISAVPATAFPTQTLTQIPLTTTDGLSISLQSQLQGIRAGQWILSPADQTFATPMVYHHNGFPLATSQQFAQQVSAIGNIKFPTTSFHPTAAAVVDVIKQPGAVVDDNESVLSGVVEPTQFITVNGSGIGIPAASSASTSSSSTTASLANSFPVQSADSSKETVS